MTHRVSISFPDDLYAHVQRVARASRVSEASVVRAAVAELLPRTSKVLDFLGTDPVVGEAEVNATEAWLQDLQRFLDTAPPTARRLLGDFDPLSAGEHFPGGKE